MKTHPSPAESAALPIRYGRMSASPFLEAIQGGRVQATTGL
jgi:hypothetical protein